MVILFLVFWGISKLFSVEASSTYIPTNSVGGFSFPFGIHFISFSCLLDMTMTSNDILNWSAKSGYPCLIPEFNGKLFSFSELNIMFVVGLSKWLLLYWDMFLLYPLWCWLDVEFYQMLFLCLLKWSCDFIFSFVNVMYVIAWYTCVEPSLQPWIEYNLNHSVWSFFVLLDLVCWYYVEDFYFYIHQQYWPLIFFFFCGNFSGFFFFFKSGWWWSQRVNLEVLLSLQAFEIVWEG